MAFSPIQKPDYLPVAVFDHCCDKRLSPSIRLEIYHYENQGDESWVVFSKTKIYKNNHIFLGMFSKCFTPSEIVNDSSVQTRLLNTYGQYTFA